MSLRRLLLSTTAALAMLIVFDGCSDDDEQGGTIPISDIASTDLGPDGKTTPPPKKCTNNDECADFVGADDCRVGLCDPALGTCTVWEKPNCCVSDADCDDGIGETVDTCDSALGVCKHEDVTKSCSTDLECEVDEPCITFECKDNCIYWQKPGCCVDADDCNDGNTCTVDLCENFTCGYQESTDPICCGETFYKADFSDETLNDFSVGGNDGVTKWHYSTERTQSEGGALRFANPETGNYENPNTASVGTATSPAIELPSVTPVQLTFWLWLGMEKIPDYDTLVLTARNADGDTYPIWSKLELSDDDYMTWKLVTIDMSAWAGQSVTLEFAVDTIDNTENSGEGVYIDDITVVAGCGSTSVCESDEDCNDDNLCTLNTCTEAGACESATVDGCCNKIKDCPEATTPCTLLTGCADNQCVYEPVTDCCGADEDCEDNNPCTEHTCNDQGGCEFTPIPECCDPTAPLVDQCDDNDACTDDACSVDGQCTHAPIDGCGATCENSGDCNDGDDCTSDFCVDGECDNIAIPGCGVVCESNEDCDDESECTEDLCTDTGACEFVPIPDCEPACESPADCNDGDDCTADFCIDGVCEQVFIEGCGVVCESDSDCEDNEPCTLNICAENGACVFEPIPGCGVECQLDEDCESDGNDCTEDSCNGDGVCVYTAIPGCGVECETSAQCNDNNDCTADACTDGECVNTPIPGCGTECESAAECNDNDDCTADFCADGACQNVPIPGCGPQCNSNADCNDNDECTADFCTDGACENIGIPGCGVECTGPEDCNDGNECTSDFCTEGVCVNPAIPGCGVECEDNEQCDDNDACTGNFCVQGQCQYVAIPGCGIACKTDAECDDSEACTKDVCDEGQCLSFLIGGCVGCETGNVFSDSFDAPNSDASASWELENDTEEVGWSIGNSDFANSPPGALYYGNPVTQTYNTDGPNKGRAASPWFIVSDESLSASLQFSIYADIESMEPFDLLQLLVVSSDGASSTVWQKSDGGVGPFWQDASVDLSAFKGKKVRLVWDFDTVDPIENNSLGVVIDDIVASQVCDGPECTLDANCDDGNPCTTDACSSGECVSAPVLGCCTEASQCTDDDECTVAQCVQNQCVFLPVPGCGPGCETNADCTDDDPCTASACVSEQCVTTTLPGCCKTDDQCNDLDECTADTCQGNACVFALIPNCGAECTNNQGCDDGNPCTTNTCQDGSCLSAPVPNCCQATEDCPPTEPCQTGQCVDNVCTTAPIAGCCTSAAQCDDNNPCTQDTCANSSCQSTAISGCCQGNLDCAELAGPCKTASCVANSCVVEDVEGCCSGNADCNDGNPCTNDICDGSKCTAVSIDGCCLTDAECNDNKKCTADTCENNSCQSTEIPDCCDETVLFFQWFGSGQLGWTVEINGASNWQITSKKAFSQPSAFWFGNAATGNYSNGSSASSGTATTTAFSVPEGQEALLSFYIYLDIQSQTQLDQVELSVVSADSNTSQLVWNKTALTSQQYKQWVPVKVNLSAFAGQSIALQWRFDSQDGTNNSGEGVFIDNMTAKVSCTSLDSLCVFAKDCDDGNPCTVDACNGGQCSNVLSGQGEGCCLVDADCEDGNACTQHQCTDGVCSDTVIPDCCGSDADCDDGVLCTQNTCSNGSCTSAPVPGCCSSNADCNDGVSCTADACDVATGTCQFEPQAGCCTLDAECNDDNACTVDSCQDNACQAQPIADCCNSTADCADLGGACKTVSCLANKCFVEAIDGCCLANSDCDDGNACTTDSCSDSKCTATTIPNCCLADSECADSEKCTVDQCVNNSCQNTPDPNCCDETVLLFQWFGSGQPGWAIESNGASTWQISESKAFSQPASFWFGNANTGNFNNGNGPSIGTAVTNDIVLPAGNEVLLSFYVYLDIQGQPQVDQFDLSVVSDLSDAPTVVWNKTALSPQQYEQWVPVKVNLSAFAGQTIKLRWHFDSQNGNNNNGEGVFIDNLTAKVSCESLDSLCVFAADCDDNDPCTSQICSNGACQYNEVPNCCKSDGECDDNYVCTTDSCGPNNLCQYETKADCCQFDGECNDNNSCTQDLCTGNVCTNVPSTAEGCCSSDTDCDDSNPCTKGICDNSQCKFEADTGPECCEPQSLMTANFDDATTQGFTLINENSESKWSIQSKRFFSAPFSLYYGIPGEWTYKTSGGSSGAVHSPTVTVPVVAEKVTLSFNTYMQIMSQSFLDIYRVQVLSDSILKEHWNKSQATGNMGQWIAVDLDLSEYKGKSIQIRWSFTGGNVPFGGNGEGIYLDNIGLNTTCDDGDQGGKGAP